MAVRYIPDDRIAKITNLKWDVQEFIKQAIDEKLERESKEERG